MKNDSDEIDGTENFEQVFVSKNIRREKRGTCLQNYYKFITDKRKFLYKEREKEKRKKKKTVIWSRELSVIYSRKTAARSIRVIFAFLSC